MKLADEGAILTLNNHHARELSWLDGEGLRALLGLSWWARQIRGQGPGRPLLAFAWAMDQDALYDNPNFRWFKRRWCWRRFIYLDRICVADAAQGRGLGRELYRDLWKAMATAVQNRLVCEVNHQPPNPASDAFHAALGFRPVGRGTLHGGAKTVTYLLKDGGTM
ncbi:GNAT family N-acetyltransferase [Formicincola oecophyllae]|uniref:GNAT family N-acetyltransferase n=1 Tax=Formicincola oecophyllae TaxID=2558361 RepID=A0A4Y6UA04_9PROT|nr:GNAT family N-acetyltransferase [Formicincola oecophyllae]